MCEIVKKILASDMPKSQKARAIYQKGVYIHSYSNNRIRRGSTEAKTLRAWFRRETIPVDPWWGTDNGSDYLCHIMSQWIVRGCPVIDISEFDEESQQAIAQGMAQGGDTSGSSSRTERSRGGLLRRLLMITILIPLAIIRSYVSGLYIGRLWNAS